MKLTKNHPIKSNTKFCEAENIKAVEVAKVTDSGRMQMFWNGQKIVDLSRAFLEVRG